MQTHDSDVGGDDPAGCGQGGECPECDSIRAAQDRLDVGMALQEVTGSRRATDGIPA